MNEQQRERATKFRVGVFVLIGLAVFLGVIYMLGARARLFEPRFTLYGEFTEVGGLQEGATVRLAGVQIGRVTKVELPSEPGGKVRVEMKIAKQFADRLRKDSEARIVTQGLLGDRIVEITVGTVKAAVVQAGDTVPSKDPVDITTVIGEGGGVVRSVAKVAETFAEVAETFNKSRVMDELGETVKNARKVADQAGRITDRIEKGPGLAHTLLYEEPIALRQLNTAIASTQAVLDRVERGEGALGVLTSAQSTDAARRLVALMDRIGRTADRHPGEDGLLVALFFDPKYRAVLDEVREAAHNLRVVSERVLGGRGMLGSLVKDDTDDGGVRGAIEDLRAAMVNVRSITDKINEGEGTLGALIVDPTVYERLLAILEGAQRSSILRFLLRGLGKDKKE